jgi:hypothetical protein
LEGLATENLGIFYDHLVYFAAIGTILWPFGIFCGTLVYFSPFWYFGPTLIHEQGDETSFVISLKAAQPTLGKKKH